MNFVDTHCHIHFPDYELDPDEVITAATAAGVDRLLCVGCTLPDSAAAIDMATRHENIWASIGLHPHEAKIYVNDSAALQKFRELAKKHARLSHVDEMQGDSEKRTEPYRQYGKGVSELATQQFATSTGRVGGSAVKQASAVRKVVAIGEAGLDFHYMHSSKEDQEKLLRFQLDIAVEHSLPLIFHVREAYDDFWRIIDEHRSAGQQMRGVIHSFSASPKELEDVLSRGFYVGLNGIMTFTKDKRQLEAAKSVPLNKLLLETDAPFLTPVPFRGTICQPKHVRVTAEFLSRLRDEPLEELAAATTHNALELFKLR